MSRTLHPRITVEGLGVFLAGTLAMSAIVFINDIAPVINRLTEPPSSVVLEPRYDGPR